MTQNVRLFGGDLLHLGKIGLHRCQRVAVKIVVDAVLQILGAEIDLVIFPGVLAVQVVCTADPVSKPLGVPSLSRSHSMPQRMSTLPLYSVLSLAMVALVLGRAAGAHAVFTVALGNSYGP